MNGSIDPHWPKVNPPPAFNLQSASFSVDIILDKNLVTTTLLFFIFLPHNKKFITKDGKSLNSGAGVERSINDTSPLGLITSEKCKLPKCSNARLNLQQAATRMTQGNNSL